LEAAMHSFAVFLAVAAAILLGAMSPGPSFVVVAQTAISRSRARGVLAALGMGTGGGVFALAALLGLQLLLIAVPSIYIALRIAGASYLLFIAYKLWISAADPLNMPDCKAVRESSSWQAFLLGLGTQVSNPKTAIVYASVFSAALPKDPSWVASCVLVPAIFEVEFGWYALVAVAFSTGRVRQFYVHSKTWIDRFAAGAMGGLGVKILADVRTS
jgi:threonine/homoserine/homoserine lactone efflux protein